MVLSQAKIRTVSLRVLSKVSEHQLFFGGKRRPINRMELWIERNKLPACMFPWSQESGYFGP